MLAITEKKRSNSCSIFSNYIRATDKSSLIYIGHFRIQSASICRKLVQRRRISNSIWVNISSRLVRVESIKKLIKPWYSSLERFKRSSPIRLRQHGRQLSKWIISACCANRSVLDAQRYQYSPTKRDCWRVELYFSLRLYSDKWDRCSKFDGLHRMSDGDVGCIRGWTLYLLVWLLWIT